MKVVCIKNEYWERLTIGKTYDVIDLDDIGYKIINDSTGGCAPKYYFKSLSEYRNDKINKLLGI